MRIGVLFQLSALITLFVLTFMEYQAKVAHINDELYYLRVQKSFQNRQSFEREYGPDWKNEIKTRIADNKQYLVDAWNDFTYKNLFIVLLLLITAYHFIRWFFLNYYDVESELAVLMRYEMFTWLLAFVYFAILSGWGIYFMNAKYIGIGAYVLSIFCLAFCLYAVSTYIQQKRIRKFTGVRMAEILISILLYFHVIGIFVLWQMLPYLLALSQHTN